MKIRALPVILAILLTFALLSTGCEQQNALGDLDTSHRGNTDGNLHNLGLTAPGEDGLSYIGSADIYDIIYTADKDGNAEKAMTGLTGYIRFLNELNGVYYFVGITYGDNNEAVYGLFSYAEATATKECLYRLPAGETVSYLTAVGRLLIFAVNDEDTTEIRAVNPTDQTEAVLLTGKHTLYDISIADNRFYYIEDKSIVRADLNGENRTVVFTSDRQPIHLEIAGDTLYFVLQGQKGDSLYALATDADAAEPQVLYQEAQLINHLNATEKGLLFSADRFRDGELCGAAILYYDFKTAKVTQITEVNGDYSGIETASDRVILHRNDSDLSLITVPLP